MKSILFSIFISSFVKTDSVCTLEMLRKEIIDDLGDDGKLTCVRLPPKLKLEDIIIKSQDIVKIKPLYGQQEQQDQNNLEAIPDGPKIIRDPAYDQKIIDAFWTSDCAFEADYDWKTLLAQNYNLKKGLVDVDGNEVDEDGPEQADICEIFRSLTEGQKINGVTISWKDGIKDPGQYQNLVEALTCPGRKDQPEYQVCAAATQSAATNYAWTIFIDLLAFNIDGKPNFIKNPKPKIGELPINVVLPEKVLTKLEPNIEVLDGLPNPNPNQNK